MRLIPQWRLFWKFWSVRISTFGVLVGGYFLEFPQHAIDIWNALPVDFKAVVPPKFVQWASYAIIAIGILSRGIHQPKLNQPERDDSDKAL
jgi:hypothetical protein